MDICEKKNNIINLIQDVFIEYNRMNETKIQSKCENDLEMKNMISTIRDLEKSEINKIKINQNLENENISLKKQIHEYEIMINNLQSKLEIAVEEEEENNKFDMVRIQAKEITLKDREIERLNRLIINLKNDDNKINDNKINDNKIDDNKINDVFNKVSNKNDIIKILDINDNESNNNDNDNDNELNNNNNDNDNDNELNNKDKDNDNDNDNDNELNNKDKDNDKDNDNDNELNNKILTLTFRKKKYYIRENENPQYIYNIKDNKGDKKRNLGDVVGERKQNPNTGKYRTILY